MEMMDLLMSEKLTKIIKTAKLGKSHQKNFLSQIPAWSITPEVLFPHLVARKLVKIYQSLVKYYGTSKLNQNDIDGFTFH